ncbi:NAD(P)/FAD-dependent oxidoreductase [Muriicola sp.]|uniref:NAD(P)/FAD-dependent oxidoreductase n=1 Tax=Muriicola sp. TaxID=2020856 RepID=UPI003C76E000
MSTKISIIGAGLSGLAAAITLEKAGYKPVIFEATSEAGGRVKTDLFEGYQLDHGFQVLLDAYPKAQEYFKYDELQLQRILPGAILFNTGKSMIIGDPSRHMGFLFSTLFSGLASIKDVYLLWVLYRKLQKTRDEDIFKEEEISTLAYLRKRGFSNRIINVFFKPFFTGIFLENELKTSCRMFLFVFKMFGKGYATIPKGGMGELPLQLLKRLQHTTINYDSPIAKVEEGKLILKDGQEFTSDIILIATDVAGIFNKPQQKQLSWHSCETLYFETEQRKIKKRIIGLITDSNALVNNIFYPSSLGYESKGEKELLSVTVVREHSLSEDELVRKVSEELKGFCDIKELRYLKRFTICKALPSLTHLTHSWDEEHGRLGNTIYSAGDHQLYGSSNAALLSGEMASKAIIANLQKQKNRSKAVP